MTVYDIVYEGEDGTLRWCDDDWFRETELDNWLYVCCNGVHHQNRVSTLCGDVKGVQDRIGWDDVTLDGNELYLVCYWKYEPSAGGYLETCVDLGLTKDEIARNVRTNKYVAGASYYTIGSVMKTTRDALEGKIEGIR